MIHVKSEDLYDICMLFPYIYSIFTMIYVYIYHASNTLNTISITLRRHINNLDNYKLNQNSYVHCPHNKDTKNNDDFFLESMCIFSQKQETSYSSEQ